MLHTKYIAVFRHCYVLTPVCVDHVWHTHSVERRGKRYFSTLLVAFHVGLPSAKGHLFSVIATVFYWVVIATNKQAPYWISMKPEPLSSLRV